MAGLQLSGIASGFDWKSVVDQLITLQRVPQNKLQVEKSTNTNKLNAFSTFRSKLTALQDSAQALTGESLFGKRALTLSDEDLKWSATVGNSTAAGEYTFNVTRLATRSTRSGSADVAARLSDTSDVSGLLVGEMRLATSVTAGEFSVNGQKVTVEATDTLEDVFDKISSATSGSVTGSYDPATDKVTLDSSGAISLGASGDSSNFLYALKLYNNGANSVTSASALGGTSLRDTITSAGLRAAITGVDAEGNGTFSINGVEIAYNVNSDSIQSVMTRVNSSAAGVTMGYDSVSDRFTLTNKNTGKLAVSVTEAEGGLLNALGLSAGTSTQTLGDNAEFSVDGGGTIVSASNALDGTMHGITGLTVNATSLGSQTVTVESDTASLDTGIKAFVKAFNDVQSWVDEQTKVSVGADGKVTSALMANNREVTAIARELRSRVFGSVQGLSGTIRRLEAIGIDFDGSSSQLSIKDSAKLSDALENNLEQVQGLFTTASTGLSARIDDYVTALTNTGGLLDTQETSLEKQNTSLDRQIADLERRLEDERTRLEGSFIRMEEAQSKINSQLASLNSILKS